MPQARVTRRPAASSDGSSRKATKWIVAIVALLLMGVTAWAYLPERQDPGIAKIQELREQMEGATDEQRRELWGQMREAYEALPEAAREQLSDERRQRWEEREQKFLNDFFALTKAEQIAKLDKDLKEDAERRKRWEARRAQQGGDRNRGNRGDRGFSGRGGRSSRDSLERRKSYLDRTSPMTRAQRSEYRRMREARRQQLGLPEGRGRR